MNLVAAYRRMTGKTQSYFADVLGISLNSYANKENGKNQFTQQEMHLFYSELKKYISDITVEDIFFKEELQKITKNKN
jgi:DNA-binding XRE family transcriptional regulator